ncbi:MAG TPA: helix-turn-helix transcriptional regulator [Woeseiaceae bacterium]|nr:helix-turn-helix transcriptional regulator [Woeseiaceae bacterium]
MRFQGRVYKDGMHWLAEVPVFDAITQGRTRKASIDMIVDWFITMVDQPGFSVGVHSAGRGDFEISTDNARAMISLLLRRQRQKSGLTLAQAADRLGAKSRNAYARYEQGSSVPTVEKLDELLRAVAPDRDIIVHESKVA